MYLDGYQNLIPVQPNSPELMEPGLKILHFPDIDFNTNYLTFKRALSVIKNGRMNIQIISLFLF